MKQLIVMVAMVILGIAVATMVFSFRTPANDITKTAVDNIKSTITMNGGSQ